MHMSGYTTGNERIPTASEIGYSRAMTEALNQRAARLDAEAERACDIARETDFTSEPEAIRAEEAVHAADLAAEDHSHAAYWAWSAEFHPDTPGLYQQVEPEIEI
jgi:hypothetical protein